MKNKNLLLILFFFLISLLTHAQENQLYFDLPDSGKVKTSRQERRDKYIAHRAKEFGITEVDLKKQLDAEPSFGVFKDVYFVTGIPLHGPINNETADAMFQLSIRQRLTKSYLPFNFFAYLTFSQKAFWDVYAESCPFRDINFNPGLGIGKYLIKDDMLIGSLFIQLEHESNGKDGEESRSWNFLSFSSKLFITRQFNTTIKMWAPYVDGGENKDLLKYRGLGTISGNFMTENEKWWITAELNPRKGWGNVNTTFTIAYKISSRHNQYVYARFYNGRGDSLLNYKEYEMNIRAGICIKPNFFNVY